jgi:hypothetical protein
MINGPFSRQSPLGFRSLYAWNPGAIPLQSNSSMEAYISNIARMLVGPSTDKGKPQLLKGMTTRMQLWSRVDSLASSHLIPLLLLSNLCDSLQ